MTERDETPEGSQDRRPAQFENGARRQSTERAGEEGRPEEPEARDDAQDAEAPPEGLTMPPWRACGYFATAIVLALAQGFGQSVISANAQQLQGSFATTQAETAWLTAAYMAPNVSITLALIKIRGQFGIRRFAEISIVGFVLAALLNFSAEGFGPNLAVRFLSGVAAAPMTSLAFLYMLEPLPPYRKMNVGLSAALTFIFMGSPVTRLISPHLLEIGLWHALASMEVALAAIGLGLIYLLPLKTPPTPMKIEAGDVISFFFIAVSFGCLAVAAVTGPIYWWTEHAWLGLLLAGGIAAFAVAACIELNRAEPLLDIRWLASPAILHFTAAILLFRLVLSEQTSGAAGLFRSLGLLNDEMQGLWLVVMGATLMGGAISAVLLKPGREVQFHTVALALLIAGSLMDARSTAQTVPSDMYLSQAMVGLASALFLPPALLSGLMSALAKGPNYILTFVIVFLTTQKLGGIFGGAIFSSFVQIRQRLHVERLSEALPATGPLVAERLAAASGALSAQVGDSALASAQAASQLAGEVQTQASVLAYNDAFLTIAAASAAALTLLLSHAAFKVWGNRPSDTAAEEAEMETEEREPVTETPRAQAA
ncbi:MFS transporter [uncultured Jannaschia sp.]|uniref:MFS transporter n=1 Tax=uncultured Jannaschia sp. TaxID=293347 RepID=UPI0026310E83|nr:MFS transporter [uncultured Jannaschia sp.]